MPKTRLKTSQLGNTELEITRIGFGAWALGRGGWEFGWGPQEDEEPIATIHHALELGINWIDTAAAYGFGHSEEILGRALEGMREPPYVFTKCSLLEGPGRRVVHNLNRSSILREAEASLERLGVDAIDLYQVHWPIPDEDIEQGWSALVELKERGLVRHIGVSDFDVAQLRRIQRIAPVETLQPPYSLVSREAHREDDEGADRAPTRLRLAQAPPSLPGAAALPAPRARRATEGHRCSLRHDPGRGGRRVDAETPGGRRRDRRFPPT
jgi:aryl-alcohol dehydrogenase-like predicted oxidoreductase